MFHSFSWTRKLTSTTAKSRLRAIYRGLLGEAFAHDAQAQAICQAGLTHGHDKKLPYIMRSFFYLPLEHAEDLAKQEQCVALYQSLLEEVPAAHKERVEFDSDQ